MMKQGAGGESLLVPFSMQARKVTWLRYRTSEAPNPRAVHILLSFAVRYPEIWTVRYDPRQQMLKLGFLIRGVITAQEFTETELRLQEMLEMYHLLEQRRPTTIQFSEDSLGDLTSLSLERDIASLKPEELFTVVEFIRERFAGRVIADEMGVFGEEELIAQEEMIEEMLDSLSRGRSGSNLIAIREDGRLMFFHK